MVDTSGAYIPGHGTPTVILVARSQAPVGSTVKAVLGVRGEPGQPADPAEGLVWRSIVDQLSGRYAGNEQWTTLEALPRQALATHPWSLSGGGASDLLAAVETAGSRRLQTVVADLGSGVVTRADEVYLVGEGALRRWAVPVANTLPLVAGGNVRDWTIQTPDAALWPYNPATLKAELDPGTQRFLWPYRFDLAERVAYGKTQLERKLTWFEYSMFFTNRFRVPLSISWAGVSTHNHFVLDRGGKAFNRWADVVKLPKEATEDDHLALLGVLNSSTACFWLKQNSHNKGSTVDSKGARQTQVPWEDFYEFTGTTLKDFPLPAALPLERGRLLDELAQRFSGSSPSAVAAQAVPSRCLVHRRGRVSFSSWAARRPAGGARLGGVPALWASRR